MSRSYIVGVGAKSANAFGTEIGITTNKLGKNAIFDTENIVEDEHLSIATSASADTNGGDVDRFGDHATNFVGNTLDNDGETTSVGKGFCIVNQCQRRFVLTALHLESAHSVHRLRSQTNVAHHWNLGVDKCFDHRKALTSTFEFHGLRASTNK
ncbi:unannotated protein [freshwater metagenome]|uniref:Unannotated protein n=1 Tax=freshwater metagenome TaxID=449393 RepID=A0A6J6K0J6_9ZZZZ